MAWNEDSIGDLAKDGMIEWQEVDYVGDLMKDGMWRKLGELGESKELSTWQKLDPIGAIIH